MNMCAHECVFSVVIMPMQKRGDDEKNDERGRAPVGESEREK